MQTTAVSCSDWTQTNMTIFCYFDRENQNRKPDPSVHDTCSAQSTAYRTGESHVTTKPAACPSSSDTLESSQLDVEHSQCHTASEAGSECVTGTETGMRAGC